MSKLHLEPQRTRSRAQRNCIEPNVWYYEEQGGLGIVAQIGSQTVQAVIPTKQVRNYLHRLDHRTASSED